MKILKEWTSDWRAYLVEFTGTFIFVFTTCGIVVADLYSGDIGKVGIALSTGFIYTSLLFATLHLSGGYLNPAITLSLWFAQKLTGVKTVFFILVQVLGSFAAAGLLVYIFGTSATNISLGAPILGVNANVQTATILEAILTGIIVLVVFSTMVDRGGPVSFGPLVLGFTLAVFTMFSQSISGAALNPVKAIGPAVVSNSFDNFAVFVVGPAAGSLFAFLYEYGIIKKPKKA